MRVLLRVAGAATAVLLVAACASAAPTPTPASAAPTVTIARTPAPTSAPMPIATPAPTPTTEPSAAGPVAIVSTVYPYRLTAPSGPVSVVSALVPWDGAEKLSTSSRAMDRARVPGSAALWIAMTDTTQGIDDYADMIEARFHSWHGCTTDTGGRAFTAGGMRGVAFTQTCAGSPFVRAVLVGDGQALVVFTDGGTVEGLIGVLNGLELTTPR